MKIRMPVKPLLLPLLLVAAACGGSEPEAEAESPASGIPAQPASSGDDLTEAAWRLVSIDMVDGEDVVPEEGSEPNLVFSAEATPTGSRALTGSTGCNRLNGSYDAGRGGRIVISGGMAMTRMACPDARMQLESVFVMALEGASRYAVDGTELRLEFGGGVMVFEAVPPEDAAG